MGYCTEAVVPFLALPNLHSFRVECFGGVDRGHGFLDNHPSVHVERGTRNEEFPTVVNEQGESRKLPIDTAYGFIMPPRCSWVTELIFRCCAAESALLGRILALPNTLKIFRYNIGSPVVGEDLFIPRALIGGLQAQASTLEEITIWVLLGDNFEGQLAGEATERLLGPLTDLLALHHLSVPLDLLIPLPRKEDDSDNTSSSPVTRNPLDRLLPRSLTHLRLNLAHNWTLNDFLKTTGLPHTLQLTSVSLPALRVFKVDMCRKKEIEASIKINAEWRKRDANAVEFEIRYSGR